jgi:hypothetical protein
MIAQPGPSRRQFLTTSGLVVGGFAVGSALNLPDASAVPDDQSVRVVPRAAAVSGGWYTPNRAGLRPTPFTKLPPGCVTPKGWVRGQLDLQLDGLNGRMYEISDYLVYDNCGWVDSSKWAWEELPYWLRGFSDLGLVTGDSRVRDLATKWIDGILATQQADGWFGPEAMRTSLDGGPDFWPSMPLVDLLRSHEEATGDERIVAFLSAFFGYMAKQPDAVFGRSWASFRWGDDIDSLYWLYNRTGNGALLDLVDRIHRNSADYVNSVPTWHNVNLSQGLREPAEYGLLAGDPTYEAATYRLYDTVMNRYGQFSGGGFAADENARSGFYDPRQGFETCGIVELMRTCEMLTRITGDPTWTDRCEELALNMLPAAFDPQQKGTHYITSANSVQLDNTGKSPQFNNGFAMQAYRPGIHIYRCCPHNYGQGWPYYSEEMWLATADNGLCASMYGASEVTAKVGQNGTTIRIAQDTDYPFGETVTLRLAAPVATRFPLWLRIPGWCTQADVRVNGRDIGHGHPEAGSYVVVERTWQDRDSVEIRLPMTTTLNRWPGNHDSVSVQRGPLTYSLAIGTRFDEYSGGDSFVTDPNWPHYEVRPTTAWNYGLDINPNGALGAFTVTTKAGSVAANPFTPETTPIELSAPVRQVPNWTADDKNVVRHLQPSPSHSSRPAAKATLIPMGAARLRVTSFPVVSANPAGHEWEGPSASHVWQTDLLDAVNDGLEPSNSFDQSMPRLTWWDHLGTTEWVQYDYADAITTSSSSVYWYDDTGHGSCRVPASWQLLYRRGSDWVPVPDPSGYGTQVDRWNTVTFDAVQTTGIRLVAQLQNGVSGGILEWRVPQA